MDWTLLPEWVRGITVGSLLVIITILGVAVKTFSFLRGLFKPLSDMVEGYVGIPARPGFNAVLSMPERMQRVENDLLAIQLTQKEQSEQIAQIGEGVAELRAAYLPTIERNPRHGK